MSVEQDTQKNTIDIAVLRTQYGTLMEDLKEVKVNGINHENKDQERHKEVVALVSDLKDYIVKEHEEIRNELAEVKSQQKVDKVRLGTLITILATLGSLALKFLLDGVSNILK